MNNNLFSSLKLGVTTAGNRVLMAPLTRGRAEVDGTPTQMMATYYAQRSSAGLIIAEATAISQQGSGWKNAPGIYEDEHIKGWQAVTSAVHKAGGRIFLQLWHMGRVSHPEFQLGAAAPVAPSALKVVGMSPSIQQPYITPRALEESEIKAIIADYAAATENALKAGFDGVEVHGANGYLIDQFLCSGSNQREDAYGGNLDNRLRFLREVCQAVIGVAGKDKVGVRLSPNSPLNGMSDENPEATYVGAAGLLSDLGVLYLHVVEPITYDKNDRFSHEKPKLSPAMRSAFDGVFIANGRYTKELAQEAIRSGAADAVAFGRPFISNPTLPAKLANDEPLATADPVTFYSDGANGYIDY